jgi:hypothetical protein
VRLLLLVNKSHKKELPEFDLHRSQIEACFLLLPFPPVSNSFVATQPEFSAIMLLRESAKPTLRRAYSNAAWGIVGPGNR